MKKVPLKKLRENLPSYAEQASKGEIIEVTKYNKPYVRIVKSEDPPFLHYGKNMGDYNFQSVTSKNTAGRIFEILSEDRDDC